MDTPRPAIKTDIPAMIDIWSQGIKGNPSFTSSPDEATEKFIANFQVAKSPFGFWVAGSPTIRAWSSILPAFSHPLKQNTEAEVSLYVSPDHSGEGIGSELMKFTLENAHTSGIERVWGFSLRNNHPSIKMCEKAGMRVCGESRDKVILLSEQPNA